MAETRKEITIVIPVFRIGNILFKLYDKIISTLHPAYDFEILFICDGCDTLSAEVVRKIRKTDPDRVNHYFLKKNYGQHRAIQFGFGKATGDFIITMDEDLQHDPADIVHLLNKQKEGEYDIVYGRFKELKQNMLKIILSNLLRKALKHFIPTLYEDYSPYRLIKRDIAERAAIMTSPYIFIDDLLSRITRKIAFTEITHFERAEGKSSYTYRKLVKHGISILIAYSGLLSWVLLASGSLLIIVILLSILNIFLPETTSSILIICILVTGLSLILLSILGTKINHRNTNFNTHPVSYYSEDSI